MYIARSGQHPRKGDKPAYEELLSKGTDDRGGERKNATSDNKPSAAGTIYTL